MGERSGTGLVEFAILAALDERTTRSRRPAENSRVLADVESRIGLAPGYAYEILLDLARPWRLPVGLIEGIGNYGGLRGDPAASFRHTASRLAPAGAVAVAAERGELAPVPIGFINGSTHRDGLRPPFRPEAMIEAVRQIVLHPGIAGRELAAIVGWPDFPAGCTVTGDLEALASGRPAILHLQARVSITGDGDGVVVENLPPNDNRDELISELGNEAAGRARHRHLAGAGNLPIAGVTDSSRDGDDRFVCIPKPGASAERLRGELLGVEGITTTMRVALPRSLPAMLRRWVRAYRDEDLLTSLATLEDALDVRSAQGSPAPARG